MTNETASKIECIHCATADVLTDEIGITAAKVFPFEVYVCAECYSAMLNDDGGDIDSLSGLISEYGEFLEYVGQYGISADELLADIKAWPAASLYLENFIGRWEACIGKQDIGLATN